MRFLFCLFLLLPGLLFVACEDDEDLVPIDEVAAPSDLSLTFAMTDDNSGVVTITPGGAGVTAFVIDFGDGSDPTDDLAPGTQVEHTYAPGTYSVTLTGKGINGRETTLTQELNVTLEAARNLMISVTPNPANPLAVDVSATADLETDFAAYFGEDPAAAPIIFTEGETITHTYAGEGTYTVRVVARTAGVEGVEETAEVVIANPLLLPVDFEDDREYGLAGFGGAVVNVIDNPDASGDNTSSRVLSLEKMTGSEVWAGGVFQLGEPLDLSSEGILTVKVWSPRAGVPILYKIENATDTNVFLERTENTTVANAWETLSFDFGSADPAVEYSKIAVFYDFGNPGAGETAYFDDFGQSDGSQPVTLPLDFENDNIPYAFVFFGGASAEVVDNPDVGAGNSSDRVVRFSKIPASEVWGGVFIDVSEPIDFSGGQTVRMKVWSPTQGATILFKIENPADPQNIFQEVQVATTTSGQWEDLSFDFSGAENVNGLQRIVLFCNFGEQGTAGDYFLDDIRIE